MLCERLKFSTLKFSMLAAVFSTAAQAQFMTDAPPEEKNLEAAATEVLGDTQVAEAPAAAVSSEDAGTKKEDAAASKNDRSRIEVRAKPFEAEGFWMNSFYFVREKGESWASISDKLYGRTDRTDLLRKWNDSKHLRVGTVVYYNSPSRPDDSETMKVFAEDFGYKMEEVTVKKGDSISKIGMMTYGDFRTWKEISALNPDIADPDVIEVGQKIRLQPKSIDTKPVLNDIVSSLQHKGLANDAGQNDQTTQNTQTNQHEILPNVPEPEAVVPATRDEVPVAAASAETSPPPATAPPAAEQTASGITHQLEKHDRKTAATANPISFKASSILGLLGTCLLVLSVGMILVRKLPKKTRKNSDNLTNIPTNRSSPV